MLLPIATLLLLAAPHAAAQGPPGAAAEFSTDFDKQSVDYDTIRSGGPPKDGIPAIDDPATVSMVRGGGLTA